MPLLSTCGTPRRSATGFRLRNPRRRLPTAPSMRRTMGARIMQCPSPEARSSADLTVKGDRTMKAIAIAVVAALVLSAVPATSLAAQATVTQADIQRLQDAVYDA